MKKTLSLFLLVFSSIADSANYPAHWWEEVPESQRRGSWEILPQEAAPGELILSKRNELGVFSNLAYSPFYFEGRFYASIEGLWQMMKYPDLGDAKDPRVPFASEYPYERQAVYLLSGFESKRAGDAANKINKKNGTKNISYKKVRFDYKDLKQGSAKHYQIIKEAIIQKVKQNPEIYKLLMKTKGLVLKPDHNIGKNRPKSYFYHKILMDIRDKKSF